MKVTLLVKCDWHKNRPTMVAGGFCPQHRLWAIGTQTTNTDLIPISWAKIMHTLSLGILHMYWSRYVM